VDPLPATSGTFRRTVTRTPAGKRGELWNGGPDPGTSSEE
jgi:hypothetical protein